MYRANGTTAEGGYEQGELEIGMFCLYINRASTPEVPSTQCPVRLGKVLRVVRETTVSPFAIVESWWPVLKDKHKGKVNLFGTWVPAPRPMVADESGRVRKKTHATATTVMLPLTNIIVWPVDVEAGAAAFPQGHRIPFSAIHRLRDAHGIDLAPPTFSFAPRGRKFFLQVLAQIGQQVHDEQRRRDPEQQGPQQPP